MNREKIVELIVNEAIDQQNGNYIIDESQVEYIADEIVKLCNMPGVIKFVNMKNFKNYEFAKSIVLKRVLEERKSLAELGRELNISKSNLSRYERQEIIPQIDHLLTICDWLELPISNFINEDKNGRRKEDE